MNKRVKATLMIGFCCAVTTVALVATHASAIIRPFPCGPRYCLDVWRPVICSNGQVYSNDCYAARACATGCVPYGGPTK